MSISYGEGGKTSFPILGVPGYKDNNKAVGLALELEPDTQYDFVLTGREFGKVTP